MMVSNGSVIHVKTIQIQKILDEQESDVLSLALDNLRETFQSNATEVVTPILIDVTDPENKSDRTQGGRQETAVGYEH